MENNGEIMSYKNTEEYKELMSLGLLDDITDIYNSKKPR